MNQHDYSRLRSVAESTRCAINDILRSEYKSFDFKKTNDVVTDYDIKLQNIIIGCIRSIESKSVIFSEENFTGIENQSEYWLIDPLDGTGNFVQGLNIIAVSVAKIIDNEVVFGFVFDIKNNDLYYAIKDQGAFLNDEKIITKKSVVMLLGVSTGVVNKAIKDCMKIVEDCNYRILGSQALHLCYVAVGKFAACLNLEAKAWDDVAGSLIVKEAGGKYYKNSSITNWLDAVASCRNLNSLAVNKFCSKKLLKDLESFNEKK